MDIIKKCTVCHRGRKEDSLFNTCKVKMVQVNGKLHRRTTHHEDRDDPCDVCGVFPGGIHHLGCDIEECPVCGNRFTVCECDDLAYYYTSDCQFLFWYFFYHTHTACTSYNIDLL